MTIALDINPLVYAAHTASPFHAVAQATFHDLNVRGETTYLFWPVAVGFVRVTTSLGLHQDPLTLDDATDDIRRLLLLPHIQTGIESAEFFARFIEACTEVHATGNLVSDAYIVALMRQHGVSRILTHDRDFRKFDGIRVVDPFP
jgi:toxin-antitoxin system PIN domain toxin